MKKLMMTMIAVCAVAFSAVAAQCVAKIEDGAQCKREAVEGRKLCWQHADYKPAAKPEAKKPAPKTEPKPAPKPAAKPTAK